MNAYSAATTINVCLIILTFFAILFTDSLWSVLILLFGVSLPKDEEK